MIYPKISIDPAEAARAKAVWTDGGCVHVNPSPHGGTWAFLLSDAPSGGNAICDRSGWIRPAECGFAHVSNNLSELLAITLALEALPEKWSGAVNSDSLVSIRRATDPKNAKMAGIPPWMLARLADARARLGELTFALYGGHPTRSELRAGYRVDGKPCHAHNVTCDQLCRARCTDLMLSVNISAVTGDQ